VVVWLSLLYLVSLFKIITIKGAIDCTYLQVQVLLLLVLLILPPPLPTALTFTINAIDCAYVVWENGVTLLLPPHPSLLLLPYHPSPAALPFAINAIDCAYVVWGGGGSSIPSVHCFQLDLSQYKFALLVSLM
jgi:hypothetical protein